MYARILVPVDGSPPSRHGSDEALNLARRLGSAMRFVHVVDARLLMAEVSSVAMPEGLLKEWQDAGERLVAESVAAARAAGIPADGVVRCEPGLRIWEVILDEARESNCDLVVMGTHGRHGLRRLALGSDAEMVLRESPLPVLLVRGPPVPTSAGPGSSGSR